MGWVNCLLFQDWKTLGIPKWAVWRCTDDLTEDYLKIAWLQVNELIKFSHTRYAHTYIYICNIVQANIILHAKESVDQQCLGRFKPREYIYNKHINTLAATQDIRIYWIKQMGLQTGTVHDRNLGPNVLFFVDPLRAPCRGTSRSCCGICFKKEMSPGATHMFASKGYVVWRHFGKHAYHI